MSKQDDIIKVDPNKIKIQFGLPDHPPLDKKLAELMALAGDDLIPAYLGLVAMDKIKPFSEFKPKKKDLDPLYDKLLKYVAEKDPHPIHVYQQGEHFIMSDDYYAYYVYLNSGFELAPCVILGEFNSPDVFSVQRIIWTPNSITPYTGPDEL